MNGPVAFFSMEYSLDDLPFAGGLGVLAADYLLEAGKQGFPLVAVGLSYGKKPGLREFGSAKLYLIEYNGVPYGPTYEEQIKQELLLGQEGVKWIQSNAISPSVYHLNEGHTAFVAFALKHKSDPTPIVATKHTVLSQSGLHIDKNTFLNMVGTTEDYEQGSDAKHPEFFSSNKYLLLNAKKSNGVSVKHCEVEKQVHQNSPLINITNGINLSRWQSWNGTWDHHQMLKKGMINYVNLTTGSHLDPEILTFVWARRLAEYKQPEMILNDIKRLSNMNIQIIFSGAVNPFDPVQETIAERLGAAALNPELKGRIVFLPHYNLEISKILVNGADVWLNTPLIGIEACGTSGMKAGSNGVLLLSTPDGWVPEENWAYGGGWIINNNLYDLIEKEIIPTYYEHRDTWLNNMHTIKHTIETRYSTGRMLDDYKNKLYNV